PWKCWHLRSSTRQKTGNTAKTAVNRGSHAVACNGFSQVFSAGKKVEFRQKSTFLHLSDGDCRFLYK
ncbi:MAG: hypothetical protein SPE54_09605, partial [Sodaliphilus sp.]|nr:hypothetical protein [Sodaliphilus sp.]